MTSPPGQRPAGEGLSRVHRITGQAPRLPKAITFSLTRDRVFGEDQLAKEIFPGSGRHVTRPSGRVSCFWVRDSLQIRLEHTAPTRARSQFIRAAGTATSRAGLEQQAPALPVLRTYPRPSSTPRSAASQFG